MPAWTQAQMASIHKMLNPRSIAVVGATPRMQYGGRFLAASLKAKDRVRVYAVNPRYPEVLGAKCYPTISDLPEAPDLVGIVVPYDQVMDTLRESHRKGAGSAIVISAGFAERGLEDRRDLQDELGAFARQSGLRVCGPNCLGVANVRDDIWASSSSRGSDGLTGPVGLICQSGASAFGPFLTRAVEEGIGLSHIISTGNEADLDFSDFARYLLDDDGVKVIAGFVEGFKDARKFIEVARLAADRGKPIVLIKIGRSELGAKAARSHTAALTGSDALYDAAFAQYGVTRVQDYDELLEVAHLLAHAPKPSKPGIAVVSHSGGVSSLTADMCGQAGLDLPPLTQRAQDGINGVLKGFGWAANPSDVTGFANSESFPTIMDNLISEPEVGTLVVASAGADSQAEQVIALREANAKVVAFLWTGTRGATAGLPKLKAANIPVFYVPDKLAKGLRSLLDYHAWRDRRQAEGFAIAPSMTANQQKLAERLLRSNRPALSEHAGKELIAGWGVPVTRELPAATADAAVNAARTLGYPVALKVDSPDILHKTEAGGVRLGLLDDAQVRAAFSQIASSAAAYAPQAVVNGVLVQEMVAGGVEAIVGVSYDPQLGPVLLFGTGGVMVEVYQDVALRLCPITQPEALDMINQVKGARLLQGFRGRPRADVDALAKVLVRVSHLAVNLDGKLGELDINPLMVLPEGQGVKAVDALALVRR
ncbi:MAG TPA: acetate--CoA ligase family protein [Dehalococcoidia bacterium]|nr:acetate--CoA ligase family protein [Dehalococcoidia bacterium]